MIEFLPTLFQRIDQNFLPVACVFTFSSILFRSFTGWRKRLKLNLGLPSNEREICVHFAMAS